MVILGRRLSPLVAAAILAACTAEVCKSAAAEDQQFPPSCLKQPTQGCIIDAAEAIANAAAENADAYAQVLMPEFQQEVVNTEIRIGNFDAARAAAEALRKAKEMDGYAKAISSIAHAEAHAGKTEKAQQLVGSAKDDERVSLLTSIADGQAAAGKVVEARKTLAMVDGADEKITDGTSRVIQMVAVAMVMARLGDKGGAEAKLDAARLVADHLHEEVFHAVSLSVISGEYASLGLWDKALSIARSISRNDFRSGALVRFVEAATRQKKSIDTRGLVAEALSTARGDPFPVSRANSLVEIASLQLLLGDSRSSVEISSEALQAAQGATRRLDHAAAMRAVARGQAELGQVRRALELALTIDLDVERAEALLEIAIAMADR